MKSTSPIQGEASTTRGSEGWAPARRRRLSEVVAAQVRQAILDGRLRPGQRIVETELAERLEVSKSPVREAMKELERDGLISISPHQGAFVRDMSAKDIEEIRTLRSSLEGLAVNLGMERADPDWTASLQEQIDLMRQATDKGELSDRHLAFHEMLVSRSDNERLSEILSNLWTQVRTLLAFTDLLYESPSDIAEAHVHLLDAIRSGDRAGVSAAIEKHVGDASADLQALWAERQVAERSKDAVW